MGKLKNELNGKIYNNNDRVRDSFFLSYTIKLQSVCWLSLVAMGERERERHNESA